MSSLAEAEGVAVAASLFTVTALVGFLSRVGFPVLRAEGSVPEGFPAVRALVGVLVYMSSLMETDG